jgi:tetratricopeptide (TPR) repeat protein
MTHDWDWKEANASLQRALALEPGNARVIRDAAALAAALGHFDEAIALARRAAELDPLNAQVYHSLGLYNYYGGRFAEAVPPLKKTLELAPERPATHYVLTRVYLAQSRPQEALAEIGLEPETDWRLAGLAIACHALGQKKESDSALSELIAKYQSAGAFQVAETYGFRGEADRAFEWLERAYVQRDTGLVQMKGDPLLKSLEHDPRYAAFLKKMRLPL